MSQHSQQVEEDVIRRALLVSAHSGQSLTAQALAAQLQNAVNGLQYVRVFKRMSMLPLVFEEPAATRLPDDFERQLTLELEADPVERGFDHPAEATLSRAARATSLVCKAFCRD